MGGSDFMIVTMDTVVPVAVQGARNAVPGLASPLQRSIRTVVGMTQSKLMTFAIFA